MKRFILLIFFLAPFLIFSQNWTQIGQDIDGEAAGDQSGFSVSMSADGNRMAVGAPYNDGVLGNDEGHVRIYENISGTWTQIGQDIDGEAIDDMFGWSVSLSSDGNTVAIGAEANDGGGNMSGHVRVFQYDGNNWNQLGQDIDGEAAGDHSGWSVSTNGDGTIVAIGAPSNDGNGSNSGHVRVYNWDGSSWVQLGNDIDGEATSDRSGSSVSLSSDGSRVAIGAEKNAWINGCTNNSCGVSAGHVRVYEWDGSN